MPRSVYLLVAMLWHCSCPGQTDSVKERTSSAAHRLSVLYDQISATHNPDSALYFYNQVAAIVLNSDQYENQILYLVKFSDFLNVNGLYDKGLEMLIRATDILESRKRSFTKESFSRNYYKVNQAFATWYNYLGDYENAIRYETKCLNNSLERNDSTYVGMSYSNLADSYTELGKYDSSLYSLFKAVDYFGVANAATDSFYYFIAIHNIGRTYTRTGNFDLAYGYLVRSLSYNKAMDDPEGLAYDYHELGNWHLARNNVPGAMASYDSALALVYDASLKLKILKGKYDAALKGNDVALTGQAMQAYFSFKDSVMDEGKLKRISQLHLLQSIKDYDEKLLQAKLRSNLIQYIGIGGVVLLLTVLLMLWYRYRLTQKANREKEQLFKEIDTLKSRFFANISHEFRTPLTLLLSPIEKRLSESHDPDDRAELALMHRSASRLLTLVNQLLDLSRLESGKPKKHCRQISLYSFVHTLTSQFKSLADSRKINFTVEVTDNLQLWADTDQLGIVITNLLSNAFKFTPEGGSVSLAVSTGSANEQFKEGYAEMVFKDSGIGIEPAYHQKIFERFFQVDDSSTREHEGSGIGLALTKELVELHHGTISVSSASGLGSMFTVKLPLGKSHLQKDELVEEQPATIPLLNMTESLSQNGHEDVPETHRGPKLLIVEDSDDLGFYLQQNFKEDFTVLRGSDGEQGLNIARQEIPDLIISDVMMPRMDGYQLCTQIRKDERTSHIPVILLTAKTEQPARIEGLETGADDYIAKPFDLMELKLKVRNLVKSRKKLQQRYSRHVDLGPSEIVVESMEDRFLKKVLETIEKHLDDPAFSVEVLARETAMSPVQLYRKLKALTNYKPVDLIRHIRLERAASLLKQHAGNVAEVAYQVGFNNLSYFAKCFKEKFGVTPSAYTTSES